MMPDTACFETGEMKKQGEIKSCATKRKKKGITTDPPTRERLKKSNDEMEKNRQTMMADKPHGARTLINLPVL